MPDHIKVAQWETTRANRVIFVTGSNKGGVRKKVEIFVDSVKKWRNLPNMTTNQHYHTSSFMGGTIYCHRGSDGPMRS